jgi:hypothetical protein
MSKSMPKLNVGRLVALAVVAALLYGAADLIFSWNPIAAQPYLVNQHLPVFRAEPAFLLGFVAEGINGWVSALTFTLIEGALLGSPWKRGLLFGLIIWGLWVLSGTLSVAVWLDVPPKLSLMNVIFGLPKSLAIAWGISWFWHRYPARGR